MFKLAILNIIFLLMSSYSCLTFCQTKILISSERDYQHYIGKSITNFEDTLSKTINDHWVFYFRFKINKTGEVDSIHFSVTKPAVVTKIFEDLFKGIRFDQKLIQDTNCWYVQPVQANYFPEVVFRTISGKPYYCLEFQVTNLDNRDYAPKYYFNNFFETGNTQKELWGIRAVFMPPLFIGKTKIYK